MAICSNHGYVSRALPVPREPIKHGIRYCNSAPGREIVTYSSAVRTHTIAPPRRHQAWLNVYRLSTDIEPRRYDLRSERFYEDTVLWFKWDTAYMAILTLPSVPPWAGDIFWCFFMPKKRYLHLICLNWKNVDNTIQSVRIWQSFLLFCWLIGGLILWFSPQQGLMVSTRVCDH